MSLFRGVPPLFPDQEKSVEFELAAGKVFDMSEPGTGKTRVRLEVFAKRRVNGGGKMLVLAPRTLLRTAWEDDARRYVSWLRVSVATAENREKAFAAKADIYVTNHDAAKWLAKQPPSFFAGFDYLVIDESDAYKHPTSQRSKAIAKIVKYFKYRALMCGLPSPNGICDLWHQMFLVDGGKRLGESFYGFRNATCTPIQVGRSARAVKWVDLPGIEAKVSELIKDVVIRNELKNVPKNHLRPPVQFHMGKEHAEVYETFRRDATIELKEGRVTAVNAAVLANKLLQIASGAVYNEDGTYQVLDRDRYEMIADLLERRKNSVVFFLWKHQRDLLIEQLKARNMTYMVIDGDVNDKTRLANVRQFQDGMYRVSLLHPKSAAHGLTMTRGKTTLWPSPTHDLAWWVQGNARIARLGQTDETETMRVVAVGTYEEKVYDALDGKNVKAVDLLRSVLE